MQAMGKKFRKRVHSDEEDEDEERRLALEEVKLLQKQRERRCGVTAAPASANAGPDKVKSSDKPEAEGEKEELVLQDTFAQETAVNVEDPNMLKYVEQELAKKRGRQESGDKVDTDKPAEDDLYVIPDHLKVRKRNSEESSTQWTTGIAEVQLPLEYKLRNIEETEAAKKQLQDKRPLVGRARSQNSIPASFSADYFQRGREYAERLRRDHPELYKDKDVAAAGAATTANPPPDRARTSENAPPENRSNRRQTATDEIMLERFRKRERSRLMRR